MSRSGLDALAWRKSSYSNTDGPCVETAVVALGIVVRDTMDRSGPTLSYSTAAWTSFLSGQRSGSPG